MFGWEDEVVQWLSALWADIQRDPSQVTVCGQKETEPALQALWNTKDDTVSSEHNEITVPFNWHPFCKTQEDKDDQQL